MPRETAEKPVLVICALGPEFKTERVAESKLYLTMLASFWPMHL